jgi:hypothetical protein
MMTGRILKVTRAHGQHIDPTWKKRLDWSSTAEVHTWEVRGYWYSWRCRAGLRVDGGGFSIGDEMFNTKSHLQLLAAFDRDASRWTRLQRFMEPDVVRMDHTGGITGKPLHSPRQVDRQSSRTAHEEELFSPKEW